MERSPITQYGQKTLLMTQRSKFAAEQRQHSPKYGPGSARGKSFHAGLLIKIFVLEKSFCIVSKQINLLCSSSVML